MERRYRNPFEELCCTGGRERGQEWERDRVRRREVCLFFSLENSVLRGYCWGGRFDDAGERGEVSAVMYIVCDEVESSTYTGPGENRAAVDRAGGKL